MIKIAAIILLGLMVVSCGGSETSSKTEASNKLTQRIEVRIEGVLVSAPADCEGLSVQTCLDRYGTDLVFVVEQTAEGAAVNVTDLKPGAVL